MKNLTKTQLKILLSLVLLRQAFLLKVSQDDQKLQEMFDLSQALRAALNAPSE